MIKRMATKNEIRTIAEFLKSKDLLLGDFDDFERDCIISVCEVKKGLQVINITEIYHCSNPDCGCMNIEYPTILIMRNGIIELPKVSICQTHYYFFLDAKSIINSRPELN